MKKLNKGFTLFEVLIVLVLLTGFVFIFLQMDLTIDQKQNKRKVGNQLNQIIEAIDKRVSIEGKEISKWSNNVWEGEEVKNFLRGELVGNKNTTCGKVDGWNPTLDLKGIDPNSEEGLELTYLLEQAQSTKLLPCSFWAIYPNKIVPKIEILDDGVGNISNFVLSFKFDSLEDWEKEFKDFNQSFIFGRDQKITTLLTSKEYFYANNSKNKLSLKQCIDLKEDCNFIVDIKIGSNKNDDKKFKIDSSNSFETNLGFAKSIKENEKIECNIWTLNKNVNPAVWESELTACGVTGGSSGFKEVALLGENIDSESVIIKGNCNSYSEDFSSIKAECGMYKDSIVQLNVINGQATRIIAKELYAENLYTSNLSVKNDSSISLLTRSYGKDQKDEVINSNSYTPINPLDMNGLNSMYRDTMADYSYKTKDLKANNLTVTNDIQLKESIKTEDLTLTNKAHIKNNTTADTMIGQYETFSSVINNEYNVNPATINNQLKATNYAEINSISKNKRSVFAGDLSANNVSASNIFQTEQLNFRNSFNGDNNILNFSKSISFDGVGNKYIYPSGYLEGWGQKGFSSNSGIAAKKIKVNGNLILDTDSDLLNFNINTSADYVYNHLGMRKGLSVTRLFPDPRSYSTLNEYGRVFVSAYYPLGNDTTGLKVGSGFFFGRNPANLTDVNDRKIITNLGSEIYNYKPGDEITSLTNGYKFIARNLSVKTKYAANFYDGAIYHKSMPKKMDGSLAPIEFITTPFGFYWETADNISLRHQNSNVLYYLNQISYIYGLYLKLNEKNVISGAKGDRGEQGETGATGERGENGKEGIPGIVGMRGGL